MILQALLEHLLILYELFALLERILLFLFLFGRFGLGRCTGRSRWLRLVAGSWWAS